LSGDGERDQAGAAPAAEPATSPQPPQPEPAAELLTSPQPPPIEQRPADQPRACKRTAASPSQPRRMQRRQPSRASERACSEK
jgi:hypothetical protein